MIAVLLMVLIARLTIPATIEFYNSQITKSTADEVFSTLKKAQAFALTRRGDSGYGVIFNPNSEDFFVLFRGDSYNPNDSVNEIFNLYGLSVEFLPPTPNNNSIYFENATGFPNWTGIITLSKGNVSEQISICENSGLVEFGNNCVDDIVQQP